MKATINRYKKALTLKAKDKGLYENFGQIEVRKLKDKYINLSDYSDKMNNKRKLLDDFNEWCMNFNDNDLKRCINVN